MQRLFDLRDVTTRSSDLFFTSHRPDDDARPYRLKARAGARWAAAVAFVFLLRALDLPVPELPLVEMERGQGHEHDTHEHDHQHQEGERGREGREDAELLHAGAVVGTVEGPVAAVQRHREPRGLGGFGRHPVHFSWTLPLSCFSLSPTLCRALSLSGLSAETPARACGYLQEEE